MALQSSGSISFADLRDEFDDTNPVAIDDFYRGGSLVPNYSANTGVPSSGLITLSDFYGAVDGDVLTITEGSITDFDDNQYGFREIDLYPSGGVLYDPMGSMVSNFIFGYEIAELYYYSGFAGQSFHFALYGIHSQTLFESIKPQDGAEFFLASADSFTTDSDYFGQGFSISMWEWNTGISKPSRWDGSGTSTVTFQV